MANDYLNIRCTFCGKHQWIASYYPGSLATHRQDEVGVFVTDHLECNPIQDEYSMDLGIQSGFEILTDTQMAKHRKEESLVTPPKK
jgi:hypothetical protein